MGGFAGGGPPQVGGGGGTDHGALTGLGDDDHTIYLMKTDNLLALNNTTTARTNLGLGNTATANFGTGTNDIARGDAVSTHAAVTTSVHGITNTANLETTTGAQTKVDTHVNDTTAAHAASAISLSTIVGLSATDVQAGVAEVEGRVDTAEVDIAAIEADLTANYAPKLVPTGGTSGQVLKKNTNANWDLIWAADNTGGVGTDPNQRCLFIASSTAPTYVKDRADIVCTGTADQITINEAVYAASNQYYTSDSSTDWEATGTTNTRQTNIQYGSVQLSEGIFNLTGPIVVPARAFTLRGVGMGTVLFNAMNTTGSDFLITNTGTGVPAAVSDGSNKGMIMLASGTSGDNATGCQIRDLFICCDQGRYQGDTPANNQLSGIFWYDNAAGGEPSVWGFPGNATNADAAHHFCNIRVIDCKYGIYFTSTNGLRETYIQECRVACFSHAGIYTSASDCRVMDSICIRSTHPSGVGFRMNAGNAVYNNCKASYVMGWQDNTGGTTNTVGFLTEGGGRIALYGCDAQDCYNGFRITIADVLMSTCRADTQEISSIGIDLSSAGSLLDVTNININERGTGGWATGINLPSNSVYGRVHAAVGVLDQIPGVQVRKQGVAVTSSASLPTLMDCSIIRSGTTALIRQPAITA